MTKTPDTSHLTGSKGVFQLIVTAVGLITPLYLGCGSKESHDRDHMVSGKQKQKGREYGWNIFPKGTPQVTQHPSITLTG